jgi:hypothetical protein
MRVDEWGTTMRLHKKLTLSLLVLVLLGITSWNEQARAIQQPGAVLNGMPVFEADPKGPVLLADWTWGQVIGIFDSLMMPLKLIWRPASALRSSGSRHSPSAIVEASRIERCGEAQVLKGW